ncbi:MAG TPA: hypothetical protein PKZ84_01715 [Anaerolineae bacterium]|nr:hypothetical protein [Anaerolineae bacterium]HQI83116.1 hypothetical protein [Anaerolineae bacterium]
MKEEQGIKIAYVKPQLLDLGNASVLVGGNCTTGDSDNCPAGSTAYNECASNGPGAAVNCYNGPSAANQG